MFLRSWVVVLMCSVGLLAQRQTPPSSAPKTEHLRWPMVVSTQWLADHLSDPQLVLIHVGGNPTDYHAVHIPGARYLPGEKYVDMRTPPGTELLPVDQLKKNFEELGIGDGSRIVFYAGDWDPFATRFFFTMDYLGQPAELSMLDGGLEQWVMEKRPTSAEDPKIAPGTLTVHPRPELVVKMDQMKALVADPASSGNTVLVDARPIKRYRNGHLAGAVPMFWEKSLIDGDEKPVLRSPQELRKLFSDRGITPGKKVVSYCEVGWQATYTYFLARYLGFDAAMYDGSYSEWSGAKQPVVRGDSPR